MASSGVDSGIVEIVREFLIAHDALQQIFARFRQDTLRFGEVESLVGDTPASPLFRLKERCHSLFRGDSSQSLVAHREALFDLAVGSLFHEAMKFRENFYQLEVYAPRVRRLQAEAGDEARELFVGFDKILEAAGVRLEESLTETETLLEQTSKQLRVLLLDRRENGLIARYLVERRALVERVFRGGLDDLLAEVPGDAASGYLAAARSYLESAHFGPALVALREARDRTSEHSVLERLESYAQGMQAFLSGDYGPTLQGLADWLDATPDADEASFAPLARAALNHIEGLEDWQPEGVPLPAELVVRLQQMTSAETG